MPSTRPVYTKHSIIAYIYYVITTGFNPILLPAAFNQYRCMRYLWL